MKSQVTVQTQEGSMGLEWRILLTALILSVLFLVAPFFQTGETVQARSSVVQTTALTAAGPVEQTTANSR